ncbi:early nodulin-like protein 6 [Apium graveolens]|uniref:early nodulin-like protein 6 n=1 Tax=Apium graveolens TaxID=4045 RepID=UPI003D7AE7CA
MGFLRAILLSILVAFTLCSSSEGYNFFVGGKNGWSTPPSESYSHWANRLRFLVNDTLTFKYDRETDSVVVVTKNDFKKCNADNPIQKMDGGDSIFKFEHSGPFYFITGNKSNCDQGQKLIIVVLAVRTPPAPSVPAPTPAPENSPAPSPKIEVPSPSPSSEGPTVSPAPEIPGPAASPAPVVPGPAASPAPVIPGPEVSSTPSPLSPGNTPADTNLPPAPAPAKSSAPAVIPAMLVTAVLGVTMAAFITFA